MKYRKGDRVLAQATYRCANHDVNKPHAISIGGIHLPAPDVLIPMPPVPPEKLLEELEKVWEFVHWCQVHTELDGAPLIKAPQLHMSYGEATELRSQRLAASQPTYQEGDEVAIRGVINSNGDVRLRATLCQEWQTEAMERGINIKANPDDIIDPDNIVSEATE